MSLNARLADRHQPHLRRAALGLRIVDLQGQHRTGLQGNLPFRRRRDQQRQTRRADLDLCLCLPLRLCLCRRAGWLASGGRQAWLAGRRRGPAQEPGLHDVTRRQRLIGHLHGVQQRLQHLALDRGCDGKRHGGC
jgi:hypothetical protein